MHPNDLERRERGEREGGRRGEMRGREKEGEGTDREEKSEEG